MLPFDGETKLIICDKIVVWRSCFRWIMTFHRQTCYLGRHMVTSTASASSSASLVVILYVEH